MGHYSYTVEEDFPKAIKHLREALRLAEEINDLASLTQAEFWLALGLSFNCEFEESLNYFEKALNRCWAGNSLWGASVTESNISCFVNCFWGKAKPALQRGQKALRIAEESDDIYSKTIAYACYGIACYSNGLLEEATQYLLKGIDLAEKLNYFFWISVNNHFLGEICFEGRDYQTARYHYEKAILFMEHNKVFESWVNLSRMAQTRAMALDTERDVNLESIRVMASENRIKIIDGWIRRYVGEILLNIDEKHTSEAETWIREAIEVDKRNDTMLNLGFDYALHAEIFKRKREITKAKNRLSKTMEVFQECGADGWVKKYEEEMAALS
jgi:tetratricopeptide (TPR) repeat protein